MSNFSDFSGSGGGKTLKMQTFNSSGTWVRPTGVDLVEFRMIGGGAAGATRTQSANCGSPGGAAGQLKEGFLEPTGDISVTIGSGGVRTTAASSYGGSGGNSVMSGPGIITVNCYGGMGNGSAIVSNGQNRTPTSTSLASYGHGGAPGCSEDGESATDASGKILYVPISRYYNMIISGYMGGSYGNATYNKAGRSGRGKYGWGDGGGSSSGSNYYRGNNGPSGGTSGLNTSGSDGVINTGSGGGGCWSSSTTSVYGGNGGSGCCIIWWFE